MTGHLAVVGEIWGIEKTGARYALTDKQIEAARNERGNITRDSLARSILIIADDFDDVHDFAAIIKDKFGTVQVIHFEDEDSDKFIEELIEAMDELKPCLQW